MTNKMPAAPPDPGPMLTPPRDPAPDPDRTLRGQLAKGNSVGAKGGRPSTLNMSVRRALNGRLVERSEHILKALTDAAEKAEPTALKICCERLLPPPEKSSTLPEGLNMPTLDPDEPQTFIAFQTQAIQHLATGTISEEQCKVLTSAVQTLHDVVKLNMVDQRQKELDRRLEALPTK